MSALRHFSSASRLVGLSSRRPLVSSGKFAALSLTATASLTLAGLTTAPAHAQTLTLGQSGTTLSGTATVTDSGTTASGIYTYDDVGTALADQVNFYRLDTFGSSTANVTGGNVSYLDTFNTSTVNISGGYISCPFDTLGACTANISGGNFGSGIGTSDTSTINLFGTGFTKTGGAYYSGYRFYKVTGTLKNGDALNVDYYDYGGKLVFNPVPEASTTVSLGVMLGLGGLGLAVRRRRRIAG